MAWTVATDDALSGAHSAIPGLTVFERSCRVHDLHAPFDEHTWLTLQGQRQVQHARFSVHEGPQLLGCAVLSEGIEGWYLELVVLPTRRGQGIARDLLDAARAHLASHGGGVLRSWVHDVTPAVASLTAGARLGRQLLILRRHLDGELPAAAIGTRPLRDEERDAWLAVSNAAFSGHPENGGWTRADLDWRVDARWTDLARWPVVVAGGRLLAGVWTKVEPGSTEGELYVVAVDPEHHGRGFGKAVVAAALRDLRAHGCTSAVLYVDADNTAALALYRSAGFEQGDVHRCFEQVVPSLQSPTLRQVR